MPSQIVKAYSYRHSRGNLLNFSDWNFSFHLLRCQLFILSFLTFHFFPSFVFLFDHERASKTVHGRHSLCWRAKCGQQGHGAIIFTIRSWWIFTASLILSNLIFTTHN